MFYKLGGPNNQIPIACGPFESGSLIGDESRIVKRTRYEDAQLSTVFLGVDHDYTGEGPPILFESLWIYSSGSVAICGRYSTWELAEAGHHNLEKEHARINR